MDNFYIKQNLLLKLEIEKEEFVNYFYGRLNNLDISNSLYDIVLLLVRSAEERFYKSNKKLGKIKKEAVLSVLKKIIKTNYDEKMLCGMIESILSNQDIARSSWIVRVWFIIKSFFRKTDKK